MIVVGALCAAAALSQAPHSWRHIHPSRPTPRNLDDAKRLHAHASWKTKMFMSKHGHLPRSPLGDVLPLGAACAATTSAGEGGLVVPTAYGADPSGMSDSSEAFSRAMAALLNISAHSNNTMADGIFNLGGATLDLQGGEYLISQPLVIVPHVGNLRIRGGTLRASPSFPPSRFLIEVGEAGCNAKVPQGVCNEFIGMDNIFLDASHIAAGGVLVANTMGTTVGPSAFFIGFVEAGLRVTGGHETILTDAWLAEYYWSDKHSAQSQSIAVELHGEDNYLSNVIVFDYAKFGVLVDGAASILSGVHTWNGGGVGISINGSYALQDRVLGCYLDYNFLQIVQPLAITVQDTFFLDTNAVLFPDPDDHSGSWRPHGNGPLIKGVVFRENTYSLGKEKTQWHNVNKSIEVRTSVVGGPLAPAQCQMVVEDEISLESGTVVSTKARQTLRLVNSTVWKFDFSAQLLFPWIDEVLYSVTMPAGQTASEFVALDPSGTTVVVRTTKPATATITMEVSQCEF